MFIDNYYLLETYKNFKELICLQRTKEMVLTTQKKRCYMNEKKIFRRVALVKIISWENLFTFPSRIQRIKQT